jgi:N utilization substance protein A
MTKNYCVVDTVANERASRDVIFDAMEAALASAAKKRYPKEDIAARRHRQAHRRIRTFRRWEVVADDVVMESPDRQIRLMDAVDVRRYQVSEFMRADENPSSAVSRRDDKRVIVQRVREAERAQVVEAYKDRVSELVTGVVSASNAAACT